MTSVRLALFRGQQPRYNSKQVIEASKANLLQSNYAVQYRSFLFVTSVRTLPVRACLSGVNSDRRTDCKEQSSIARAWEPLGALLGKVYHVCKLLVRISPLIKSLSVHAPKDIHKKSGCTSVHTGAERIFFLAEASMQIFENFPHLQQPVADPLSFGKRIGIANTVG